jgi:hypothetical protein
MKTIKNIKNLCEIIWQIEEQFDLLNWEVSGIKPWQALRMEYYYKIAVATGLLEHPHPDIASKNWFNSFLYCLNLLKNALLQNAFYLKKFPEALIIPHPRVNCIKNEYYDIYTKYLIDSFRENDVKFAVLEFPFMKKHLPANYKEKKYADCLLVLEFIIRMFSFRPLSKAETEKADVINAEFINLTGVDIKFNRDIRTITKNLYIKYKVFKMFLQYLRPEKIYLVCNYRLPCLIKAAKELNIKTVEIQHGVFSRYHLGYSYPMQSKEHEYFPDVLYTWGKYWSEQKFLPVPPENRLVYGFKHFNNTKIHFQNSHKRTDQILIISQGAISKKLANLIIHHINDLNRYKLIYKLHPGEYEAHRNQEIFKKLEKFNNIKLETSKDLYNLASTAFYIIGVFSTAIYESIALGCKPVICDLPGAEYLDDLICKYNIPLLQYDSSISEVLARARDLNINENDLFEK